eukprot:GFKZ01008378.1.p2 GENE.GFKZ01008378.1~~GFKZ01008378.1.p2  ORF type:complete len:209 (-),score=7.37 GFKZ01008378.1:235-861(-)
MHISEEAVLRAVRSLNSNFAPGPDQMFLRLLHVLTKTRARPNAGVTGLLVLTAVVTKLVQGDLPDHTIPLISSATVPPIQKRAGKIRPIPIGMALRRLVTKLLLPQAIEDTKEHRAHLQVANEVPCGLDSIVREFRRIVDLNAHDDLYSLVSVDEQNALNTFSRQRMIDMLLTRAPMLCRFLDLAYKRTTIALILPAADSEDPSQKGM